MKELWQARCTVTAMKAAACLRILLLPRAKENRGIWVVVKIMVLFGYPKY